MCWRHSIFHDLSTSHFPRKCLMPTLACSMCFTRMRMKLIGQRNVRETIWYHIHKWKTISLSLPNLPPPPIPIELAIFNNEIHIEDTHLEYTAIHFGFYVFLQINEKIKWYWYCEIQSTRLFVAFSWHHQLHILEIIP